MNKSDCQHIGTLVKLYGYKGEYVLALGSYLGEEIENWESVFIDIDGLLVPFFIHELKLTADTTALVSFDDITSETLAKKYLNYEVFQLNALVSPPEEIIPDLLQDYEVFDKKAGLLGKVQEILNYNQNLLLKVAHGKKEILVPIVDHIVLKVNHKKKQVTVDIPEGLLDLND